MTQQPNERLLPCPWCHRDDCLELGERLGWQIIYCDYCGACGPYPVGKLTPEEAWNTRVPAVQGVVEAVARAICTAGTEEPGLCFRDDDPHEEKCVRSCVGCRNVARAAIQAMSLYAETTSSESSS